MLRRVELPLKQYLIAILELFRRVPFLAIYPSLRHYIWFRFQGADHLGNIIQVLYILV